MDVISKHRIELTFFLWNGYNFSFWFWIQLLIPYVRILFISRIMFPNKVLDPSVSVYFSTTPIGPLHSVQLLKLELLQHFLVAPLDMDCLLWLFSASPRAFESKHLLNNSMCELRNGGVLLQGTGSYRAPYLVVSMWSWLCLQNFVMIHTWRMYVVVTALKKGR